jgi:hypothetical protein
MPDDVPWLRVIIIALATGTCLLASRTASGLTIAEEEDAYELQLGLLGQAEVGVQKTGESTPIDYGYSVSQARLDGRGIWSDVGTVRLQVDAADGTVRLLDAAVELTVADPVRFRIGQFKTPISAEFLIGIGDLIMIDRALLRSLVPDRRVGGEVRVELGDAREGDVAFSGQLGLFNPVNRDFADPQGQLLTARGLVEFGFGLDIHAAYGQLIFADNDVTGNPTQPGLPEPFNQTADFALQYDEGRINAHAEALAIFDAVGTSDTIASFYSHFGYRVGAEGAIQVEPLIGYDYVSRDPTPGVNYSSTHRLTLGANLYWLGSNLVSTFNYRLETRGEVGHAAYLQLQAVL